MIARDIELVVKYILTLLSFGGAGDLSSGDRLCTFHRIPLTLLHLSSGGYGDKGTMSIYMESYTLYISV
jgi:hypothetical protein